MLPKLKLDSKTVFYLFFQFYDVATLVIIYKEIELGLAIDQLWE
jgi:hypothetical protein